MNKQQKMIKALKKTHFKVTSLLNNYYKYNQRLPNFEVIDQMIFNTSEEISDPRIRGMLRQVVCTGIIKITDNTFTVGIGVPERLKKVFGDTLLDNLDKDEDDE